MEDQNKLKFYNTPLKIIFNDANSSDVQFIFDNGGNQELSTPTHLCYLSIVENCTKN